MFLKAAKPFFIRQVLVVQQLQLPALNMNKSWAMMPKYVFMLTLHLNLVVFLTRFVFLRNCNDESSTLVRFACFLDYPTINVNHFLGKKQTKTCAASGTKTLNEKLRLILCRYAYTVILINQLQRVLFCFLIVHSDCCSFFTVFSCVIHKVIE